MVFVYAALFFSGVGTKDRVVHWPVLLLLYVGGYPFAPIVGWLMDGFGLSVMFIFTPAFMLLAVRFMLGVKRSEPKVEASLGKLEMVGEADF